MRYIIFEFDMRISKNSVYYFTRLSEKMRHDRKIDNEKFDARNRGIDNLSHLFDIFVPPWTFSFGFSLAFSK